MDEKKKRGRKPKAPKTNQDITQVTQDQHVLHLNIITNSSNINHGIQKQNEIYESKFCRYNPSIHEPNAYNEDDNFISQPYELYTVSNEKQKTNSNVKVLLQNVDSHDTDVACYWCCHRFDTPYVGLPLKYRNNVFEIYGCFCSLECVCAYNFDSRDSSNTWETYNLINLMANMMEYEQYVYPAPPRKCLKMFGGYMTIDEFRIFKKSKRFINVNKCPLVITVDQIEEINDFYHKQNETVFNFDKERLNNIEMKLSQENKKNIEDNFKNTLDSTMKFI